LCAFVALTVGLASSQPAQAGEADSYTSPNPQHRTCPKNSGLFDSRSTNDGSGPGKSDSGEDGFSQFPQIESVKKTEERVERLDDYLRKMSETSDSDSETESEGECIDTNSAHYSETITVFDGYNAESINSSLDHQLVKHGHQWGIDDIDLKATQEATESSRYEKPEQVRTRLTPANRNKLRANLREFASRPTLQVYPNYPINKGVGRAYFDPETQLFIGIDENGIIRKAYIATPALVKFLNKNCK